MLASLVALAGCGNLKTFNAYIWKGGVHEITREVEVDGKPMIEYVATNEPKFLEFRCMRKDHMAQIVRAALERCPNSISVELQKDFLKFLKENSK